MYKYQLLHQKLKNQQKTWLVTGVAGFIGSNLLEVLLGLNQRVVGLDNFSTGYQRNLDEVQAKVSQQQWDNFHFIEGDIRDLSICSRAMFFDVNEIVPVDHVLHQAALGSVPRSIVDPIATNQSNVDGFLNMLVASRDAGVQSFVYAASSSTYGDHPSLPKVEDRIGKPLSPYAVTKYINELYADVFAQSYGFNTIGLRYFNVFGPRQDPNGSYAAVIPKWINALLNGETVFINGDGETSRDFCYVTNAVQANLLAALTKDSQAINQVYNVAVGERTTLNKLFKLLCDSLQSYGVSSNTMPSYSNFRPGDVRHSQADIHKAISLLGYFPSHRLKEGIIESLPWYAS